MTKLAATLLLIASLTGPAVAAEFEPDARFPKSDQARELLAEGVKEYRAGRPAQAAVRLRDALKLEPENKLVYEFYLAVGDRYLIQMQENDQLEDVLKDVLRRANIYRRELRHSDEYIAILIGKLEKTEEERLVATNELVAVGPIAVPHLIARMNDDRQDEMRVYCRIVLTKMGYRAVVPLVEALNAKDERLVASVATVLGDIADTRALPKLKQLAESPESPDTVKRVVANSLAAITKRNSMDAPPPAPVLVAKGEKAEKAEKAEKSEKLAAAPVGELPSATSAEKLYFLEASRYFRGGDLVQDEMVANESLMWRWNEDEATPGKKLSYLRVPRYAWNELMAEELLFDGATYYNAFTAYQPLLAATLAAEDVETGRRQRLAKERTTPTQNPDEALDAIAERVTALEGMSLRVRMFGPSNIYRAIQQSIVSERYDAAAYLMRLLQDRYIADCDRLLPTVEEGLTSEKPGTVLVAALDHADKTVRYQAAITLAAVDPALQFFNAEKVVPLLADAVGEWGMRVVVVVDQDYRQRNTAREQLQKHGFLVYTANNGFDLMQRLEETPIKDAIVIAGDLLPNLRDEFGGPVNVPEQKAETLVELLKTDWRAEKTPVFISLPEDATLAGKIQAAFEGKVAGFIKKPFAGTELEGAIEIALKDAQLPNVNRETAEDVSLRAALALGRIDPTRTQYDLAKAAEALVGTIDARADGLRIATLTALGLAAQHPTGGAAVKGMINKVTDVYGAQDGTLTPEVRAAFLYAIGQLDPNSEASVAILLAALKHDDAGVRTAAADAIGHSTTITNELLHKYQLQQRLDVRAPGAGPQPGATAAAAGAAGTAQ